MQEIMNRLSIRKSDYIVTVGDFNEIFLSRLTKSAKGMACVGKINKKKFPNLRKSRVYKSMLEFDHDIFNKALVNYRFCSDMSALIDATEHMGLVLLLDVTNVEEENSVIEQLNAKGIFEVWTLKNEGQDRNDILFRVRKYL